MSIIDKSRNMYPDSINILKSLERYISSTCNITKLTAHTLLIFRHAHYQPFKRPVLFRKEQGL